METKLGINNNNINGHYFRLNDGTERYTRILNIDGAIYTLNSAVKFNRDKIDEYTEVTDTEIINKILDGKDSNITVIKGGYRRRRKTRRSKRRSTKSRRRRA